MAKIKHTETAKASNGKAKASARTDTGCGKVQLCMDGLVMHRNKCCGVELTFYDALRGLAG